MSTISNRWERPAELPSLRFEQVQWTGRHAFSQWLDLHEMGTKFAFPAPVRDHGQRMLKRTLQDYARRNIRLTQKDMEAAREQADFVALAEFEEQRWADATLFSVSKPMTMRAARTGMTNFFLPRKILPKDSTGETIRSGVIVWQAPIGTVEVFNSQTKYTVDPDTGAVHADVMSELIRQFGDAAATPTVAASYTVLPDDKLWVVFYADALAGLKNSASLTPREIASAYARGIFPPFTYEREQILPLDQETPWFTSDSPDRLIPTGRGRAHDSKTLRIAADRNFQGLPMIEQMCRTLTATLIHMWDTVDKREVVYPSKTGVRRLRNAGAPEYLAASGVRIVNMGEPIRYKAPRRREDADWHWTERRWVDDYTRQRQYVPATGEMREGPFLVKGYMAGPPDAPIRNIDKVLLLK